MRVLSKKKYNWGQKSYSFGTTIKDETIFNKTRGMNKKIISKRI
ncbi:Hypothetical Protein SLY_0872 [Strawberry lethal yellows phytoplasma (CPA) str. NZSb11]|uniref:Uncharacterized protein n=1 Tax=Strawberry lethal yellows phytoplasma (CPA) str. NZSb11 TaxID=980422 RepID=R4RXZ7_PHYAS|nr:Hypothetical Protein SLY_0872 [Strawberry lethal yellows phytoplasma (CPA) str. NZSb11]